MAGYCVKRIDEMEGHYRGAFKLARAELDVSAFGMQIIDLPPGFDGYPQHDHSSDGQEEVYVALRGAGEIEIDGERHALEQDSLVRVSAGTSRKVFPGEEGIRMLVIGGVPGKAYEVRDSTKLGSPDPMAAAT